MGKVCFLLELELQQWCIPHDRRMATKVDLVCILSPKGGIRGQFVVAVASCLLLTPLPSVDSAGSMEAPLSLPSAFVSSSPFCVRVLQMDLITSLVGEGKSPSFLSPTSASRIQHILSLSFSHCAFICLSLTVFVCLSVSFSYSLTYSTFSVRMRLTNIDQHRPSNSAISAVFRILFNIFYIKKN